MSDAAWGLAMLKTYRGNAGTCPFTPGSAPAPNRRRHKDLANTRSLSQDIGARGAVARKNWGTPLPVPMAGVAGVVLTAAGGDAS